MSGMMGAVRDDDIADGVCRCDYETVYSSEHPVRTRRTYRCATCRAEQGPDWDGCESVLVGDIYATWDEALQAQPCIMADVNGYLPSHLWDQAVDVTLTPGTALINGVPIDQFRTAIDRDGQAPVWASNHSTGFAVDLPEGWTEIGYIDRDGLDGEVMSWWTIDDPSTPDTSQPYFLDLINRIDEVVET